MIHLPWWFRKIPPTLAKPDLVAPIEYKIVVGLPNLPKSEGEFNSPHDPIVLPFTTGAILFDLDAHQGGPTQIEVPRAVSPSPDVKSHPTSTEQVIQILLFLTTDHAEILTSITFELRITSDFILINPRKASNTFMGEAAIGFVDSNNEPSSDNKMSHSRFARRVAHGFLHGREMPPRKKSIAKKPTPKVRPRQGSEGLTFTDLKLFERYQFFSTRKICQPYHLDLEVARHFGLYDEVAAMVALTEWRYLLMEFEEDTYVDLLLEFSADELSDLMDFKDVQQIHEEELGNRMYRGKGEKRARVSEVAEEKFEEVEYDGAEPAGVTTVEGSSRGTFQ
nr:hypothetical protein Iba_chr02aCG9000 [Ipomoea batatas]